MKDYLKLREVLSGTLDQAGGGLWSHGIEGLNQSIAVYTNILAIFPQQDYRTLTATLSFISGDDPVRSFLLDLCELFSSEGLSSLDTVGMAQQLEATGETNLDLTNIGI